MEEGSQSLERPPTEEEGEMGHHFFTLPYYHRSFYAALVLSRT